MNLWREFVFLFTSRMKPWIWIKKYILLCMTKYYLRINWNCRRSAPFQSDLTKLFWTQSISSSEKQTLTLFTIPNSDTNLFGKKFKVRKYVCCTFVLRQVLLNLLTFRERNLCFVCATMEKLPTTKVLARNYGFRFAAFILVIDSRVESMYQMSV